MSGLVVGRLPKLLIPAMTQSLLVPEEFARNVLLDVWGGLAVLLAEMCRPDGIALVLEGSGVEVKQALIFGVCGGFFRGFFFFFFFCLFV